MQPAPVQEAAQRIASATTYVGSGGAVFFGLTANEFAAIGGLLLALLGFVVNLVFRWQHLQIVRRAAVERPDCATCPERTP